MLFLYPFVRAFWNKLTAQAAACEQDVYALCSSTSRNMLGKMHKALRIHSRGACVHGQRPFQRNPKSMQ